MAIQMRYRAINEEGHIVTFGGDNPKHTARIFCEDVPGYRVQYNAIADYWYDDED